MKLFKKLAIACLTLFTAAGIATACSQASSDDFSSSETSLPTSSTEESSSEQENSSSIEEEEDNEDNTQYVYRIKVQNATGFGFKNVTVRLKNGDEVVAEKTTSTLGLADFGRSDILTLGNYDIEISDIPNGYKLSETAVKPQTIATAGFSANIQIEPTDLGPLSGKAPQGTLYSLANVMHDFTVKTTEDTNFTLSKVLEEKDMVLINFWATWCGPCKSEFPAMNAAYEQMKDDVAIIAISTEPTDSASKVSSFKSANALQFDVAPYSEAGAALASCFDTSGIPVSIMVDRYGVISYYHMGSMTAATDFTSRFNKLVGDNYKPTVLSGAMNEGEGEGGEDGDNMVKPTVDFPKLSDIKSALSSGDDFTFEWDTQDEYAWPWLIVDNNGNKTVQASVKLDGNYATLIAKFTAQAGDTLLFDYDVLTEERADIFYVLIDEVPIYQISGNARGTGSYVFRNFEEGEHTVHFLYLKDGDTSIEGEHVNLGNLRLENNANNAEGLAFHHAANAVNVDKDGNLIDKTKNSYYQYYESVVLNETDGYYHVGTKDGPILFANLMLSSRWSETSVWMLAYSDYIISEGYNFHADIEDYAWEANQPVPGQQITYGYTPVTENLRALLEHVARSTPVKEYGYKYWTGDYHENEWLEMCVFWQHYGETKALEDPMKTITFHAAQQVFAGENGSVENTAKVLFAMTPRGFKYKFIPEKSGVYNVYSTGNEDTTCFLVAEDRKTFLGEYTDVIGKTKIVNGEEVYDDNFYFHYYFEAGKTYYLLLTTHIESGYSEYPFYIDYVGDEYSYLENLSVGPYSYNEISGELFLPDAKDYTYVEAEDAYYVVNADGSLGGKIYVDMLKATAFFPHNSLYQTAVDALDYEEAKRAFYVNGKDYSYLLANIGYQTTNNTGEFYGYAALNKELFEAICAITRSAKYDGISDSWQLLCYYYRTLKA